MFCKSLCMLVQLLIPGYLVPVLQLVVRQVELTHVCAERSNLALVPRTGNAAAVQNQDAGQVEAVWGIKTTLQS